MQNWSPHASPMVLLIRLLQALLCYGHIIPFYLLRSFIKFWFFLNKQVEKQFSGCQNYVTILTVLLHWMKLCSGYRTFNSNLQGTSAFLISHCWLKQQHNKSDKTLLRASLNTSHAVTSQDSSRQQQGVILKLHLKEKKSGSKKELKVKQETNNRVVFTKSAVWRPVKVSSQFLLLLTTLKA